MDSKVNPHRSHRTSRRGHDIISGLRRDMETQVPSRNQDSRFSDIVGFDNRERKNIPMTPRDITSQPIISVNKHGKYAQKLYFYVKGSPDPIVHEFVREKNRAKNLNRAKIVPLNC